MGRRCLLVDGYVARGGGSKKRKGAKGWLDVRVEMTGRIEWNGDARKRKKKRRRIEGVMVDRRTAAARLENSVCVQEWMVALLNARTRSWKKVLLSV